MVKNPPANVGDIGDMGSILWLERSPGGEPGNPLQYSCLEKSIPWTEYPGGWHSKGHKHSDMTEMT